MFMMCFGFGRCCLFVPTAMLFLFLTTELGDNEPLKLLSISRYLVGFERNMIGSS